MWRGDVELWPHPVRHGVGVGGAVVVVEHEDSQHHAARHHPHDAVEVGSCRKLKYLGILSDQLSEFSHSTRSQPEQTIIALETSHTSARKILPKMERKFLCFFLRSLQPRLLKGLM